MKKVCERVGSTVVDPVTTFLALPPNDNANGHQPTPKKGFCVARGLRITKENVYVPSESK